MAAMRMLAYAVTADAIDNYVRIGESTAIDCLGKFIKDVISVFEGEYLQRPNANNVQRLLWMEETHDFPNMMGSIDCMHYYHQHSDLVVKYQALYLNITSSNLTEDVELATIWVYYGMTVADP
ncbi:hypothetical protein CRG98_008127 [Punica granatum]|uniref:Uncharacterized protein n=1 Tax=Punica granatum TaxID=22663 RepID=A0A2I0KSI2_PUNGR|nr:hypothetical protein CRG98_008127 [Punica granatum]